MLKWIAEITVGLWLKLYPERQVYIRSNGRVRYALLRPSAQASLSLFFLFCLMWTAIASANFIFSKQVLAARDARIVALNASNDLLSEEIAAANLQIQSAKLDQTPVQQQAVQDIAAVPAAPVAELVPEAPTVAEWKNSIVSEAQPRPRPAVTREDITVLQSDVMPRERPRRPAFVLPNLMVTENSPSLTQQTRLSGVVAPHNDVIGYLAGDASTAIVALEKLINQTGLDADTMLRRLDKVKSGTQAEGGPLLTLPATMTGKYLFRNELDGRAAPTRGGRLQMLREALFSLPLAEPVDKYYVSSSYGYRKDPFTHAKAFHSGVDMVAPHGDPVLASAPGIVVFAARNGPYGNMVEIDHGNGVKSRYGHLSKINVTKGQKVGLRHLIGLIGNTGRSGTAHLHFEVWFDGKARNPRNFLKAGENVFQRQG